MRVLNFPQMAQFKRFSSFLASQINLFHQTSVRRCSNIHQILFHEPDLIPKLENQDGWSDNTWQDIRQYVLGMSNISNVPNIRSISTRNVDVTIMNMCGSIKQYTAALEYYNFLKNNNYEITMALVGTYFNTISKKETLTELEQQTIIETYENVKKKHPVLDRITAGSCIHALCRTNRWKESISLFDDIEMCSNILPSTYNCFITAAIKNNDMTLAWKYLKDPNMQLSRAYLFEDALLAYLNYCREHSEKTFESKIEEMFTFWGESYMTLPKSVMDAYLETCMSFGWSGRYARIVNSRKCESCKKALLPTELNDKDFKDLSTALLKDVVIGSDVFIKTDPIELERFMKFINETKPYDLVIDTLNIVYTQSMHTKYQLPQIIIKMSKQHRRVLLIARQHLRKYISKLNRNLPTNVTVYYISDKTHDDIYILYSTLASGNQAKFLSCDLMREHKCLFKEPRIGKLFKLWQLSHQYRILHFGGIKRFVPPLLYYPYTQKIDNTWHIPLSNDIDKQSYDPTSTWLCLSTLNSSAKK